MTLLSINNITRGSPPIRLPVAPLCIRKSQEEVQEGTRSNRRSCISSSSVCSISPTQSTSTSYFTTSPTNSSQSSNSTKATITISTSYSTSFPFTCSTRNCCCDQANCS